MPRAEAAGAGAAPQLGSIVEAAQLARPDLVAYMLAGGYDVDGRDADGNSALHWAASLQLDDVAERLLSHGARPDARNSRGETPAHYAAKASNVAALSALLDVGGAGILLARDQDGFTPFLVAVMRNDAPLLEWMWLSGADVDDSDDRGRTGLQWACYKDYRRTAQWLLSRSACVGARDHEGLTALHWASVRGNFHLAKMLVNAGGDLLAVSADRSGDTPAGLACKRSHWQLGLWLIRAAIAARLTGSPATVGGIALLFPTLLLCNAGAFWLLMDSGGAFWPAGGAAACWPPLALATLALWAWLAGSDPGCLGPRTVWPQRERLRQLAREGALDLWGRPFEEQIAAAKSNDSELRPVRDSLDRPDTPDSLERLELLQRRIGQQRRLLACARRTLDDHRSSAAVLSRDPAARGGCELQPLIDAEDSAGELERLCALVPGLARSTAGRLARLRLLGLLGSGEGPLAEYTALLQRGDFRQLCVVCRRQRTMRSYHCKECGRCVERLDHHCPWIDNCVGLGNQRLFYVFLVCLVLAVALSLLLGCVRLGGALWRWHDAQGAGPGEAVATLLLLGVVILDGVFGGFAAWLLGRQTAYMAANVTTYEVLVVPKYIQRRFPRRDERLWFLRGRSPWSALIGCVSYWTADLRRDVDDFGHAGAPDSPLHDAPGTFEADAAAAAPG